MMLGFCSAGRAKGTQLPSPWPIPTSPLSDEFARKTLIRFGMTFGGRPPPPGCSADFLNSCPGRLPRGVVRAALPLATMPPHLLAIDAEIVMQDSHRPVRIYRDMHGLVHQIVISGTLADHPEVVHEREVRLPVLKRALEALLGHASGVILGASSFAGTADTLWLEVEVARNVVAIDSERDQSVERAA